MTPTTTCLIWWLLLLPVTPRAFTPLTFCFRSRVAGLKEESKVQLNYVRGLNRTRLTGCLGSITEKLRLELDEKLRTHLGL